jgi:hypothetical protein
MATIISVDDRVYAQQPANGKEFTLQELQDIVGGYIEFTRIPRKTRAIDENGNVFDFAQGMILCVNEEGWILNPPLPLNQAASLLTGQPIAGNAIALTSTEAGEDNNEYDDDDEED